MTLGIALQIAFLILFLGIVIVTFLWPLDDTEDEQSRILTIPLDDVTRAAPGRSGVATDEPIVFNPPRVDADGRWIRH